MGYEISKLQTESVKEKKETAASMEEVYLKKISCQVIPCCGQSLS